MRWFSMGKVRDIKSIARPINLNDRQEKLHERRKEIQEKHEYLKKKVRNFFRN